MVVLEESSLFVALDDDDLISTKKLSSPDRKAKSSEAVEINSK